MVGIAQLVERLVVVQEVAGSSPVTHPKEDRPLARTAHPGRIGGFVFDLDADRFEALVGEIFDDLPDDMVDGLDNVAILIEDRPEDGSLNLLGLYSGVALTDRGQYGFGELPDVISIYREPLLGIVDDEEQLREQVRITLIHEIAHFYGIGDEELHSLGWG
jgi:predicted Zn-dependent protease with MMP-like domain